MQCFYPIKAYQRKKGARLTFKEPIGKPISIRCGQCIGCKLRHSQDWGIRCMHEAQMHQENTFITLTYSSEQYNNGSLDHKDFQKFIRDTRYFWEKIQLQYGPIQNPDQGRLRYFMGGEYGDKYKRPHYHACLFGIDFPDKKQWNHVTNAEGNYKLYTSQILEKLWPHGFNTIGAVTYESANYVARYCTKKISGEKAETHYTRIDENTGEIATVQPEYGRMSLRPGIGSTWIQTYKTDVYGTKGQRGYIEENGIKRAPPKYYDRHLAENFATEYDNLLSIREEEIGKQKHDNTPARLRSKETVAKAKMNLRRPKLE